MSKRETLLAKAKENPKGLRFSELLALAGYLGWYKDRSEGSHYIYKKKGHVGIMTFQEGKGGKAKSYQVKQLLNTIGE